MTRCGDRSWADGKVDYWQKANNLSIVAVVESKASSDFISLV